MNKSSSLPSIIRYFYGFCLIALAGAYWLRFPGSELSPGPGRMPPPPPFVPGLAAAGIVALIGATIAEFIATRTGRTLAYISAILAIAAVIFLLAPGVVYGNSPPPEFAVDRIEGILLFVVSSASLFVAMLPKNVIEPNTKTSIEVNDRK